METGKKKNKTKNFNVFAQIKIQFALSNAHIGPAVKWLLPSTHEKDKKASRRRRRDLVQKKKLSKRLLLCNYMALANYSCAMRTVENNKKSRGWHRYYCDKVDLSTGKWKMTADSRRQTSSYERSINFA